MCKTVTTGTCAAAATILALSSEECEKLAQDCNKNGVNANALTVSRSDRPPGCFVDTLADPDQLYYNEAFNSTEPCSSNYYCFCCDRSSSSKCLTQAPTAVPTAPTAAPSDLCAVADPLKADCGYLGIDAAQCANRSCCWRPTQNGSAPWCYHTPTEAPSAAPSSVPTPAPFPPTGDPSAPPTQPPARQPTRPPAPPTRPPTQATPAPTRPPSAGPSAAPARPPSGAPSAGPSERPSRGPTAGAPSAAPETGSPSSAPATAAPSPGPSVAPSARPSPRSAAPSAAPSAGPSPAPLLPPSAPPLLPSAAPSAGTAPPSARPTAAPSTGTWAPTYFPISVLQPTAAPLPPPPPLPTCAPCRSRDACHLPGVCDAAGLGCSDPRAPDGSDCDDEDPATYSDACLQGECVGHLACFGADCVPANPHCHSALCDAALHRCVERDKPDGAPCDDMDEQTAGDSCAAGVCAGVRPSPAPSAPPSRPPPRPPPPPAPQPPPLPPPPPGSGLAGAAPAAKQGATVLSHAAGPAGAKTMVIMHLGECRVEDLDLDPDRLDWELHPVGAVLGNGGGVGDHHNRYFIGAVLWNGTLVLIPLACILSVACALHFARRESGEPFAKSLATVRAPGIAFAPFLFLAMGTSLSASHLAFFPDRAPPWCAVVGWVMLLFMTCSPFVIWGTVLRQKSFKARFVPDPRLDPTRERPMGTAARQVYRFCFGAHAWVSTDGHFVECLGICFESYLPGRQWWLICELGHIVVLAFFPNWTPDSMATCATRNILVFLLLVAYLAGILRFRPYASPFESIVAVLLAACNASAVLLMTIALAIGSGAPQGLWATAVMLLAIAAALQFVLFCFILLQYISNTTAQGQRRALGFARRGLELTGAAAMLGAARKGIELVGADKLVKLVGQGLEYASGAAGFEEDELQEAEEDAALSDADRTGSLPLVSPHGSLRMWRGPPARASPHAVPRSQSLAPGIQALVGSITVQVGTPGSHRARQPTSDSSLQLSAADSLCGSTRSLRRLSHQQVTPAEPQLSHTLPSGRGGRSRVWSPRHQRMNSAAPHPTALELGSLGRCVRPRNAANSPVQRARSPGASSPSRTKSFQSHVRRNGTDC